MIITIARTFFYVLPNPQCKMSTDNEYQNKPAATNRSKSCFKDLFTPGGFRKLERTCYKRPLNNSVKKLNWGDLGKAPGGKKLGAAGFN